MQGGEVAADAATLLHRQRTFLQRLENAADGVFEGSHHEAVVTAKLEHLPTLGHEFGNGIACVRDLKVEGFCRAVARDEVSCCLEMLG